MTTTEQAKDGSFHDICLVDDDVSVQKSIRRLLESCGFKVQSFDTAENFLPYLAGNAVPLVILDIWTEKRTGMKLLAHLHARSPATRVILISGQQNLAAEPAAFEAGAFDFFIKPLDNDRFVKSVRRALQPKA
jgi:DNA-binding NtrC family response regulator